MFNFKKQIRKKSLFAKKELIGIGVLTVCFWAIVLPFLETFTKFVSHDDNIGYFRPLFIEACAQLFNGNLPLWNFYSSVGQPLLGDSQSMALYPVLHVSYLIGGRSDILGAFFIIHIFISLFSMYLFLRSLGIVSFASFLGSVSYATGGAFLSFSRIWITMMPGFSFLPLLFFCTYKACRTRRWHSLIPAVLAYSCILYSGYFEYAVFSGLLIGFFLIYRAVMLKRFFPVYIGIGILFFAVLLSVPVLYESLSLIKNGLYSTNNDDYEHFIWGGAPWYSYLIGFIFPKVSGTWNFFEPVQSAKYFYVSSVIGVFFLFALLQKFKYKTFWCGSFAFVYLWLLGDVFFLSQFVTGVLFKIPVLQLSHWVVKHFLEYSFLLSVVGSFGIHSYLSQTQNYPPRWFVSFVSVIVLLLLIGIFKGFISSKDFILADALYFLPALLPFIPYQYTLTRKISLGLLFILLFAYSFPFLYKFEFFDRPEEKNLLMIDSLKMQEGNDRSLAITKNFFWLLNDTTLRGLNVGTASHKPSMNQRSIFPNPIGLILYGSVNNSLFGIFGDDSWEKRKKLFNRRFLNLLGVRYLYIAKDSMLEFENFGRGKEDRWEVLEATNWGVKLENADFKGLIFSPKTVQKDSRPNLIEKLIADERIEDLMDNAYVNKIPNSLTNNIVKTHSISNFNGKIEIKATCTRPPCFLTMSYWYYPGWFLKINGIKKDLYNVDGFLMGAFLDSGKNYIILEYRPFLKIVYWILWSIFLILLVLYLFLSLFKLAHSRP